MPTTRHSHTREPSSFTQIIEFSGTMSPTFQPNFSASTRPTIAPSWVDTKARHWSSGIVHSG